MAKEIAKENGFPWVIIKGATHEMKSKRDTRSHQTIPGVYLPDKNQFTITLTTDPKKLLVDGHIYVEANEDWVPTGLMRFRAVNGIVQPAVDLQICETDEDMLARIAKEKAEANKPENRRGGC